jgi:hypothetical protein
MNYIQFKAFLALEKEVKLILETYLAIPLFLPHATQEKSTPLHWPRNLLYPSNLLSILQPSTPYQNEFPQCLYSLQNQ